MTEEVKNEAMDVEDTELKPHKTNIVEYVMVIGFHHHIGGQVTEN